jgi:hypothetical protein
MQMDGWANRWTPSHMTKLTGTFHDCENVPKNNGFIVALMKERFNLLQQGLK